MIIEERDLLSSQEQEKERPAQRRAVAVAAANGSVDRNFGKDAGEDQASIAPKRRRRVRIGAESQPLSSEEYYRERIGQRGRTVHFEEKDYTPSYHTSTENTRERKQLEDEYQRKRQMYRSQHGEPRYQGAKTPGKKQQGVFKKKNTSKAKKARTIPIPIPEPIKFEEQLTPDTEIRLNKFLANSGVCSRREADNIIARGEVSVNGQVVTELGVRVKPVDEVRYKGELISRESKVYILLNKPKNTVTTLEDPEGRKTVMDLIRNACKERVYPVGRLDRNTMGVLLITNDGELASKLAHPSYKKKKIYHVWLNKPITPEDMQKLIEGIELEDGEIHADAASYVKEGDLRQIGLEIHSGRNRIVRRMFEHLGYTVIKLDRVYFAGLTKKDLPRGRWRYLDAQEVANLKMSSLDQK